MSDTSILISKTPIDSDKISNDLSFLRSLASFCEKERWRLVLYGGYGLDFALGVITRPHRDIDVVIFGVNERASAVEKLTTFLGDTFKEAQVTTQDHDFLLSIDVTSSNFAANAYYVQTVHDPKSDLHAVRKKSGEEVINSEDTFPAPVPGNLDGFGIEVQNQNAHLADILSKRSQDKDQSKYDQDIANLKQITDPEKVKSLLALH